MKVASRLLWKACLAAGLLIAIAADVNAGWMGFQNETKDTVVVQETIVVNGQQKPGRPQRLNTGEAVRDTQCQGTQKQIAIYDPKNTKVPLFTGNFACPAANENVLYIIKPDGKGGIMVEPNKMPVRPVTPVMPIMPKK
jgi:hypothetical protein